MGVWATGLLGAAGPAVTEVELGPAYATAELPVSATLELRSASCFTPSALVVAVRDKHGDNLDFPGAGKPKVCPSGYSLTTGTRAFAAGTYTIFGAYEIDGSWTDLPSMTMVVRAAPKPAPAPPGRASGKALAWSDEFNSSLSSAKWSSSATSSYRYGNHNPDDSKLDWLFPADVSVADGVATFTAQPSNRTLENGQQAWTTGLLTTEGTSEGFQVRAGDYMETRVKLPIEQGAWPALWTWKDGGNEIDSFEYHPDNPNLLEFTNHVNPAYHYYTDASAVRPGQWVTVGTSFGASSVQWFVNGRMVYEDHTGVGSSWSAFLILNLSVSAGEYHPAPESGEPISFAVDYVRVYR
ncbi:glycoside hydrolase family 16 protein [Streptacidiphilus melanogenes]|uniref:glycoside hydrolase family 16 protein n=1 Tax=Streptacidiphilus melanogenes TaxID=411235 RepID=UPI0034E2D8CA